MAVPVWTIRANWQRSQAFEDYLVSLSPAGYWRCSETAGTDLFDRAGGNHGSSAGTVTLGQTSSMSEDTGLDRSVTLDGSTAYLTVPDANALDVGDAFTFVAAVYRAAAGAKHYVCQKGTGSPGIYIGTDDKVYLEKVGTGTIVASTTTIPATTWTLVAVTKTGADARIYIGGIDRSGTITNQTTTSTASALEWGRSAVPGDYFDGRLDELACLSSVLTPKQVSILASAWANGELGGTMRDITARIGRLSITGGRNGERSGDQAGTATLGARNREPGSATDEHFFTAERNLAPNASMGFGLHDVESAVTGLVTAGATHKWLDDAPTGLSYSVGVTTPASADRGAGGLLEGLFRSGEAVTLEIAAKADSGTPTIQIGLGSTGTPADIATANRVLSTSWQTLAPVTWTPTGNRTDAAWFARDNAGAGISYRVTRIQVNRGATANTWLDGPTWPMLQPGALAHVRATFSGTTYEQFAGHVARIRTVPGIVGQAELYLEDAFGDDLHTKVDLKIANRTHRDVRYGLIDAVIRKLSGSENRCINGSFPSDTGGWTLAGGAARNTSEKPVGTASIEMPGNATATYNDGGDDVLLQFYGSRLVMLSFSAKLRGAADNWSVTFGRSGGAANVTVSSGTAIRAAPTGSAWTRYALPWVVDQDTTGVYAAFTWTSADAAKGGYIGGVMITEGAVLPDYIDFGAPTGRVYNWLHEAGTSLEYEVGWKQGWSNLISNPEAVTDTSGWTAGGAGLTFSLMTSGQSDTDAGSYDTSSVAWDNNTTYYAAVHNYHATDANGVNLTGGGLTWVEVATIQYAGSTRRLSLFRARVASGATTQAITIDPKLLQTATGCAWQFWEADNSDTSGTNGSGSVIQSVTASAAATTVTATLASALATPFSGSFVAMGSDAGSGSISASTGLGTWTNGTANSNAAPTARTNVGHKIIHANVATTATSASASNIAVIVLEVKPGTTTSTLTRVTAGGYAGGFSTAFENSLSGGSTAGSFTTLSLSLRSGVAYTVRVYVDTLGASGTWDIAIRDLGSDEGTVTTATGTIAHGTGSIATLSLTPTADRTILLYLAANAGVAITFSGVMAYAGSTKNYAREGMRSPASLDVATSITTVDDTTLGRKAVEIVTRAAAGSGAVLEACRLPQVNGVKATLTLLAWVPSGTATVRVGLGDPWGIGAAEANSADFALSTTIRRLVVPITGSSNNLVPAGGGNAGQGLVPWVASTGAAVAVRVADAAVTLGTAMQPYHPPEADGVDAADTDLVTSKALVDVDALGTMAEINDASMARHWVNYLGVRPWYKVMVTARQSIAAKTVAETWTGAVAIKELSGSDQDRGDTYQAVTVDYDGATELLRAQAAEAIRDRLGIVRTKAYDAGAWITSASIAQAIADLRLSRLKVARARWRVKLTDQWASMLARRPDDLVELSSTRGLVQGIAVEILSRTLITDAGGTRGEAMFDTEDWVPS